MRFVAASLFVLSLLASVRAHATVAEAMSLRALVAEADLVARVYVVQTSARYDELDRIVTDSTLRIDEPLFGAEGYGRMGSGTEIVVTRLGGELDGLGLRVEGEATFQPGESVLLFARDQRGELRTVGMSQGVFPIEVDPAGRELVLPNAAGLALVAPGGPTGSPAVRALPRSRPLTPFLDELRSLIAEVRGAR